MSMCHWHHVTCDINLEGDIRKYIIAIIQSECMISTGGITMLNIVVEAAKDNATKKSLYAKQRTLQCNRLITQSRRLIAMQKTHYTKQKDSLCNAKRLITQWKRLIAMQTMLLLTINE